ncbi:MAG TPA: inositol monophosphatase family protein [Tepidiformaceae bacterium]
MPDRQALLQLAIEIAHEAGALLTARQATVRQSVSTKSTATDMVTQVDKDTEALIVERILAARPDDGLLGEEGASRPGTSGVRWVIDPLDGTTNYIYGWPAYAVAIGVEYQGEAIAGVVHDAARNETFSASLGSGASLNGRPISVGAETSLANALVGTGFGYAPSRRVAQAAVIARIIPNIRDIRRGGSAAIDLCHVACGRLDAYYEYGLNPWDSSAGDLIVCEAGGLTSTFTGTPIPRDLDLSSPTPGSILATNPTLHAPLLALLEEAGAPLGEAAPPS